MNTERQHPRFFLLNIAIFLALLIGSACGQSSNISESKEETNPVIIKPNGEMSLQGFALLELFTSEGCSSCPPADRLLRDVIEDAKEKGLEVYALSFHVDYWNRLGWKDPYSKAAFSDRQRAYARALNSNVYTPQLVVNGKEEFVGSNRAQAAMSIKKALDSPFKKLDISLDAKLLGNHLSYSYTCKDKLEEAVLHIALVESDLSQEVSRGENRGRTLKHDNVVRAFESIEPDALMGRGRLELPEDIDQNNIQVIFFVQEKGNGKVLFAKTTELMAGEKGKSQ